MKKNEETNGSTYSRKKAGSRHGAELFQLDRSSPEEIHQIIHDLHTHQIELALQNEELRESQLKLEESRVQYRDLYDHAPVGYFSFDEKGRIIAVNLTGSRLLGAERDSLHQTPISSYLSEEDSDLFYLHLKKVFAAGNKQTCALTLLQKNGAPIYAQLDSIPFFMISGKTSLCQTTITDISVRKQLEEALIESETRYRRLFEAAREGILLIDAKTENIFNVNPFLLEMLGYSLDELLGKKIWEIGCFNDIETSKDTFRELQSKGYLRYEDLPLETKGGRILAVEIVSTIYMVHHRRVIQCNVRDITNRKFWMTSAHEDYNSKDRRMMERRVEQLAINRQLESEIQEHRLILTALRKTLAENEKLKDRVLAENIYFSQELKKKRFFGHIIGQSDSIKYVLYRAEQVAPVNTTVLVQGETGTGKELIAAAIHQLSPRKDRPLVTVNCAALPANLLESELFGREKGAFTGAETRQIGRFEIADGSTLCLDEIGELPLEMQAKLLRVIQHGEFERLGSPKTIKVDVRIIATTNRNLEEEILAGGFRKDLFYRLNVFPITVPPLRQRREDIPLLVEAFVERYSREMGKQITSIPKNTMEALQNYSWPGNVRELEGVIERAVILCPGPGFQLADALNVLSSKVAFQGESLEELERHQIRKILSETGWRIEGKNGAANILGLHPSTLRARMKKLSIVRPTN